MRHSAKTTRQAALMLISVVAFGTNLEALELQQEKQQRGLLRRFSTSFPAMGVQFKVVAYCQAQTEFEKAIAAVKNRIAEIESSISHYDPSSEINRLVANGPSDKPVKISSDLWNVLYASRQIAQATDNAFDPTLGPLTDVWKMARKRNRTPSREKIEIARSKSGWDLIQLHEQNRKLQLKSAGMKLDFGGIGKGYAADEAITLLRDRGIASALINAGGDISVSDRPPGKRGWTVGIEGRPGEKILLENQAVATSGDDHQHLNSAGKRYSHIIDPRSGLALNHSASVIVIATRGTLADGWASALSVLGLSAGIAKAEAESRIEARFLFPGNGNGNEGMHQLKPSGFGILER